MELENEIEMFKKYLGFSEGEKLISIKFNSVKKDVDYSLILKNTEWFSKIESMIYKKYPKYTETENFFLVSGNKINRNRTLEENKIKNNDVLTLSTIDF